MNRQYFIANWKMNKLAAEAVTFASELLKSEVIKHSELFVGIAPAFTALHELHLALHGSLIHIGAQNVHWLDSGAHTGEISPPMLLEYDVDFVIVGHSERRQFYGETNSNVSKRAQAALAAGLSAVVCVGEPEQTYRNGETLNYVRKQLTESLAGTSADQTTSLIIAYEPIWAIGTGLAATPEVAEHVHGEIRETLTSLFGSPGGQIPIIYGGSTTPENIAQLCARKDISGALVGGASLNATSFIKLISEGQKR